MASTYDYVILTGTIIPDVVDTRSEVAQDFKDAFGQDLVVTDDTPQGVLINYITLGRNSVARNNATLANQINPNLAGGIFFDAIWALTGGERNLSVSTIVPGVVLAGVPGTPIPAGVTAQNTNGDIFSSNNIVTLDDSGQATVDFTCVVPGSIDCIVNTLTTIVSGVVGWETVNNPNAAILGNLTQSDESARFYRKNTLALQGMALPEAITSALYAIPGFKSLTFRENITNVTTVIDGVTMVSHSIYVCADGGTDNEIAFTLLAKKSAGANWNNGAPGATPVSINVTDPSTGQLYPVKFDRPALRPILCRVTIRSNQSYAVNGPEAVKQSILNYANGLISGESGFVVGANVSPFELAGAINIEHSEIFVSKVEVAFVDVSPIYMTTELTIEIFQKATITLSSIQVISI